MTNKPEEKQEEFDKLFKHEDIYGGCLANKYEVRKFVDSLLSTQRQEILKEIIGELESNPNPDGSISPNIQHWIEAKQAELRNKFITKE